jgi:FdrA protein
MIDPEIRIDKIKSVVDQPETAVVVFDVVLGYGAHEDMANALKPAIVEAKEKTDVTFVAVVVGTDEDRQNMSEQISILEEIGVIVCENNVQALQTALAVVGSKLTFSSKEVVAKQASTLEELPAVSSSLAALIAETPKIINIGLQSFTDSIIDNKGEVVHFEWRPSAGGNVELQKVLYFLNQYEFDAK